MSGFIHRLAPRPHYYSKKTLGLVIGICAIIFVLLAVSLDINRNDPWFFPFDQGINSWVDHNRPTSFYDFNLFLDKAGYDGSIFGNLMLFFGLLLCSLVAFLQKKKTQAQRLLISSFFGGLTSVLTVFLTMEIKDFIARLRPADRIIEVDGYSFPSGHSTATTAFCFSIALLYGRKLLWALATLLSFLMMASRVYLSVHWATDTIGGFVLALTVTFTMWILFERIITSHQNTKNHGHKHQKI